MQTMQSVHKRPEKSLHRKLYIHQEKTMEKYAFNEHLANLQTLRIRLLKNIDRVRTNLRSLEQQLQGAEALISTETEKELNKK